jgi:DNA repair protein RadA/Sms
MNVATRHLSRYTCTASCGYESDGWSARCPACGDWVRSTTQARPTKDLDLAPGPRSHTVADRSAGAAGALGPNDLTLRIVPAVSDRPAEPRTDIGSDDQGLDRRPPDSIPMSIVDIDTSTTETRISTGLEPLDRVLGGGGLVVGSLVLIGGLPGAGKSTLLMQMMAQATCRGRRLYVTGEESQIQVAMRGHRIGATHPDIKIVRETDVDSILWHIADQEAKIAVIDSIHTIRSSAVSGIAGSDYQVKACGQALMNFAKSSGVPIVAISHVNKDGGISGPMNFEHTGDATLMFMFRGGDPDDPGDTWRELRALKNRFGSTAEVGAFLMGDRGLVPVERGAEPPPRERTGEDRDDLLPVAQELAYRLLEAGVEIDPGLRDRIAGRLDLAPRGAR